ncbi:GNAT family N-acetyltransferase [Pectobacterium parmentieri]|uniref:GNAT family N-acetyltransferase n=1 Tax=Pectobacterium parmentieri TaxID=1905730 RepID=UPI0001B0C885|nr:GNAT family N-acetyltransferase [Pectobacterium parmentieri]ACX88143.1 GCN5-related N-acetyltransferase [Pectobacterium parmentieri WPP163]AYH01584.1 N-acetyltransferase [Pectobacterium parmentieri]AYH05848.1 N-acetyltransferase [Pectobacterium parmentieri]AYH14669.1 N-acetyltransferase [Pectobacterium parmentieri]AYH23371.1 N-acetyltransferase [Pectobacterium parmentieri]
MVNLTDMNESDYPDYRQFFILEYAQDLQASRGYDAEKARAIATQSIDIALPQGSHTPANKLWSIQSLNNEGVIIGYLWVVLNGNSAWVSDFSLLPAWRGRGFGKASLAAMDVAVAALGIREVGLRVATHNPVAKALYEKQGFQITGFNMHKSLESDSSSDCD